MRPSHLLVAALVAAPASASSCSCGKSSSDPAPAGEGSAKAPLASAASAPEKPRRPAPNRQGNVVARSPAGDVLYVVDEDASQIHLVPLPFGKEKPAVSVSLPGRPAEVLPLDGEVLVTIRDPGLLLVLRPDPAAGLVESARVALPGDAWGIAITKDEKTALVSSAWTHKVSGVDLAAKKVRFSLDVAREPRGIAILQGGTRAYVNHLVGSEITRIDGIESDKPSIRRVALPAAPLRVTFERPTAKLASLGYALTLSPDESRLYVARHGLGAVGTPIWFGVSTVDILLTRDDSPLVPPRKPPAVYATGPLGPENEDPIVTAPLFASDAQPRAMAYRKKSDSLLVVSEGSGAIQELTALSMAPSEMGSDRYLRGVKTTDCGAPSGIALSEDESTAFVFCRSSNTLAVVALDSGAGKTSEPIFVPLGKGPDDPAVAEGRRLFYTGEDEELSDGIGCAGCHPEGRDDGHVWTEIAFGSESFQASPDGGSARQTPMLAGRVASKGPYGWHGESDTLEARIVAGTSLHRWRSHGESAKAGSKAAKIAAFLQKGLVPPPREEHEATEQEKRGKTLFESAEVGCKTCHAGPEHTDRVAVPLPRMGVPEGFDEETNKNYKTPSLLFVGGTPPYFHDGSAATLEDLVRKNDDRMGKTNQLSAEDQAALVAYLRTL